MVAIAAITVATGGSAAVVFIGAGIGAVTSLAVSAGTQLAFTGEIDLGQLLLDVAVGAVMGAFGGSTINSIGNIIAGGVVGFSSSVASDLMNDPSNINFGMAILSVVLGAVFSAGPGAQYSKKTPQMVKQMNRITKLQKSGASQNHISNDINKLEKMALKTYNLNPIRTILSGTKLNIVTDVFTRILSVVQTAK